MNNTSRKEPKDKNRRDKGPVDEKHVDKESGAGDPGTEESEEGGSDEGLGDSTSIPEVEAPDLEVAREEWFRGEKRQKRRFAWIVVGSLVGLGLVTGAWFHFVSIDTLPMVCEAAVTKVQKRCGFSRRESIQRIKKKPPLVEGKDKNRRETCRVLASPDHEFWRKRALTQLFAMSRTNETLKEILRQRAKKNENDGLSIRLKVKGKKEAIPVPTTIKKEGTLSDVSRQFIQLKVMPDFINERYCKKLEDGSR